MVYANGAGEKFKEMVRERGYTFTSLAQAAGLTRVTISKWANTETTPDAQSLIAVARVLKVSPAELFRLFGISSGKLDNDIHIERVIYFMRNLPPDDREELAKIAEVKFEHYQARKEIGQLIDSLDELAREDPEATFSALFAYLLARGYSVISD